MGRSGHDRAGSRLGLAPPRPNESSLYVVSGILRLEFEGEAEPLDAHAGDFVHVPAFTIHRESNRDEPSLAVIARAGGGIPTVNVDAAPPPHR